MNTVVDIDAVERAGAPRFRPRATGGATVAAVEPPRGSSVARASERLPQPAPCRAVRVSSYLSEAPAPRGRHLTHDRLRGLSAVRPNDSYGDRGVARGRPATAGGQLPDSRAPPSRCQCGDDHSTFGPPLGRDRRVMTIPAARSVAAEALASDQVLACWFGWGCARPPRGQSQRQSQLSPRRKHAVTLHHQERLARSAADGVATTESPGCASSGVRQWSIAPRSRKREILSGCICIPSGERHRGAADEAVRDQGEHSLDLWLAYWRPRPGARVTVRRRPPVRRAERTRGSDPRVRQRPRRVQSSSR